MQLELFGTDMDTSRLSTDIKVRPRTKLEEAIFKQKNEAAWKTEQARKKAVAAEENRRFQTILQIGEIAGTFEPAILEAIENGKTSCVIEIPEDCWKASVVCFGQDYLFKQNISFENTLDSESEFFYRTQVLAASGVSYQLEQDRYPIAYGPYWTRRTLTLSW